MVVKKLGGKVYGADFTAAEKKAIDLEIQRELAEYERKHINETDALVLYVLHEVFGFGAKRLKVFYERFDPELQKLLDRYEMDVSDETWLCTRKLKEIGIDIEEWAKENQAK